MSFPRLGLGTVQFGLDYGISNRSGRPGTEEVGIILTEAATAGLEVLDTAPVYGDAENRIGMALPAEAHFRIVTKTMPVNATEITADDAQRLLDDVERSRRRLRCDRLYGLMAHRSADLFKPGGQRLIEAMEMARDRGWVERIGASMYDADDVDALLRLWTPSLVQLPINALDQRLCRSGHLVQLSKLGVEIHARSVFLQGLLLMEPEQTPPFFAPIRPALTALRNGWHDAGLSSVEGALAHVLAIPQVETVVVGATKSTELRETIAAARVAMTRHPTVSPTSDVAACYLNPALWPAS